MDNNDEPIDNHAKIKNEDPKVHIATIKAKNKLYIALIEASTKILMALLVGGAITIVISITIYLTLQRSENQPTTGATLIATAFSTSPASIRIQVPSNSQNGVNNFMCSVSGLYTIVIESGAYNPFPTGQQGWWRTRLAIFVNDNVKFGEQSQPEESVAVGSYEQNGNTSEQAEQFGQGQYVIVNCQRGDYLRLVAIDRRGGYADNVGNVVVSIHPQ